MTKNICMVLVWAVFSFLMLGGCLLAAGLLGVG